MSMSRTIRGREINNPIMLALIHLTVEAQAVVAESGPGFEEANPSFMLHLRAAQDIVNNALTTGEGLQ
jgi:hypothetical protein